ncbi:MAG: RNA polymerase sigma factor [Anaerolineae bacterium]
MKGTDEAALVERAKGEPEAFGELYRRYVKRIYNYHYRHTSDRVEAEDLTSRTFHKALRNLHRYQDQQGASFQSWLFRIAHNLVVNWYRDRSRHPQVPLEALEPLATGRGNPRQAVEKAEEHTWLLRMIDALPEDRKTLIVLKFVEHMTNAEIGEVLGKTEGAVKALYYRTLRDLRQTAAEGE